MDKRKRVKKLALTKETLRRLEPSELQRAAGREEATIDSWNSDCNFTCGEESCLGVCSLNCSWIWIGCNNELQ